MSKLDFFKEMFFPAYDKAIPWTASTSERSKMEEGKFFEIKIVKFGLKIEIVPSNCTYSIGYLIQTLILVSCSSVITEGNSNKHQ